MVDVSHPPEVSAAPRGRGPPAALAIAVVVVGLGMAVAAAVSGEGRALGLPFAVPLVGLAFAINWAAFVPSYALRNEHYYDLVGSLTYQSVTLFGLLFVLQTEGPHARALAVVAAVLLWALRLGLFLFWRVKKDGGDGRFDEIKQSAPRFFIAWTLQGAWVSLTLAGALVVLATPGPEELLVTDVLGGVAWGTGFAIEVVADAQKRRFRARESNETPFIQEGLWARSRHPNYFGEILLWVGVAVVAAGVRATPAQWALLASPAFVAFLLLKVSGVPLLQERNEERYGDDPRYRAYVERTPLLVPRLFAPRA